MVSPVPINRAKRITGQKVKWLKVLFTFLPLYLFASLPLVHAEQKLDIGAEYRLRGLSFTNPTYASEEPLGQNKTIWQKYYSQRARVYLKGNLNPKIEISAVLQAIGVSGFTQPLLGRYPKEDFTPFLENIYIKADEIQDWPVSLTFGRQPYIWGSGLLISDDGLGFDGLRLDVGPFWGFRTHFFHAKNAERLTGDFDKSFSLAGLSYKWGIHHIRFGWINERDRSGTPYSHLRATTPVSSDDINRQFINLNLEGRLEKGAFYNLDFAIQRGKAKISDKEIRLSGSALTFEGGFDYIHPRYKRMILAFVFMQGSGDLSATADEDEKFFASFGRRYDGLERVGIGEFLAASPSGFFNDHTAMVPIRVGNVVMQRHSFTNLFSGIRSFGFRGSINPWEPFLAGLEFHLFSARETPDIRNHAPTTITDAAMGRELVISGSYLYAKRIQIAIRWGHFWANPIMNGVVSTRLLFEVSGKF